jgi:hypothetical protein
MAVVPGFYQWVRFTPETTYGVFNSGGTPFWVRLEGDDGFNAQLVPARTVIRSADAWNRRVTNVSSRYAISANLRTPAYPSQVGVLLGAAATLTGSTPPVISSYTADHFDGQVIRRYMGGVNSVLDLTSSADSQYADLATQWVFQQKDDSNPATLPAPAETVFPSESPYLHTELAGKFTLAGAAITQFDQFHLTIRNTIAAKFYENAYIAFAQWCGRDVDLTTHLTYVDTTWRGFFEAQTALTLVAEYYRTTTKNLTLDFKTVDIISDRSVSRPLGGVQEQGVTVQAFYDAANTNDFAFTALYS